MAPLEGGGANGSGTVFEATYSKTKGWVTSVLYSFAEPFSGDGVAPQGGLTMDNNGNLYGTTSYGGAYNYYGAVFKLSKLIDGTWGETILHSFSGPDGNSPEAVLAKYGGWLYGTAPNGGNGTGVVYKVRP